MRSIVVLGVAVILGTLLLMVYATVFLAAKTALLRPSVRLPPS
jgi:hypothetical protein